VRTSPPSPPLNPRTPIRVLVVDDSATSQKAIADILSDEAGVKVIGEASDGEEALQLALELRPDCICLDLGMPRMDGFTFLRLLMARQPTPVLVISSNSRKQEVFKALELGALDFIAKPGQRDPGKQLVLREELLAKIATVRALRIESLGGVREDTPASGPLERREASRARRLVVIGASTGGPTALTRLFSKLEGPLPLAYAVALHMPERFTGAFAERLSRRTGLDAREARDGEELCEGRVVIAPGGRHLRFDPPREVGGPLRMALVRPEEREERYCPSADLLFESAAAAMRERVCAVVLTGMGDDGCRGVRAVAEAGGLALAESPESAVVYGMPRKAAETGRVEVLSLDGIADRLARFAGGR